MQRAQRTRVARHAALFVLLLAATAWLAHARPGRSPGPTPLPDPQGSSRIEVAFVLDTTGSMAGLIAGAKQKIWSVANRMASAQPAPEIRVALIGYRDRGDVYVTRRFDLTPDIDRIYAALQDFVADGGGDTPESVNQALHEAVTRLDWSGDSHVYRVIFLVGDAPPHLDYPNDVPYRETLRLAAQKDIVVNTVQCGQLADTTPIWREIAQAGRGRYAAIAQDGGMLALATPMDDELVRLNQELAKTVLPYGVEEEQREILGKVKRSLSAAASVVAARLSYLSRSGGRANLGRPDLVDAVRSGEVDAAELPAEVLPEPLRPMSPADRREYVEERIAERAAIQERIRNLARERESYLAGEAGRLASEGRADAFDDEVLGAIRDQAAAKGISYE